MRYFEKIAVNLKTMKKIQKVINTRLIKGKKIGLDMDRGVTLVSGAGSTGITHAMPGNKFKGFRGKIILGKGGGIKSIEDTMKELRATSSLLGTIHRKNIPDFPKGPKQKEMINRIIGHHELSEATVSKKNYGRISSHFSIDVLSRESNLLASLPKRYKPTVDFRNKTRNMTGETKIIREHIPNFEYGVTHLSPAAKKHLIKKMKTQ